MNKTVGKEIYDLGATELEADYRVCDHDWTCWARLFGAALVIGGAILGTLIIIARMWIILGEQVAAL